MLKSLIPVFFFDRRKNRETESRVIKFLEYRLFRHPNICFVKNIVLCLAIS